MSSLCSEQSEFSSLVRPFIKSRAALTFPAKALPRKYRCANAPNAVNFAERPLAGIHAKLTKLRDNTVVAMRGFACASNYLVHKFCFKLLKQNFVSLRGNPNGFPLAVRHFGAHILL